MNMRLSHEKGPSPVLHKIRDNVVFLREFIQEFETTGAAFPTSKWAAHALTHTLASPRKPLTILEVGPGTGAVTERILEKLQEGDHLTICEINPRFMKLLKAKLALKPNFKKHQDRIRFFEGPIQDLPEDRQYDVIVSALPFLNFDISLVREIFEKLGRLSKEQTTMTYYEYIGLRSIARVVSSPRKKQRMKELDAFFHEIAKTNPMQCTKIWLNVLPINVYTLDVPRVQ